MYLSLVQQLERANDLPRPAPQWNTEDRSRLVAAAWSTCRLIRSGSVIESTRSGWPERTTWPTTPRSSGRAAPRSTLGPGGRRASWSAGPRERCSPDPPRAGQPLRPSAPAGAPLRVRFHRLAISSIASSWLSRRWSASASRPSGGRGGPPQERLEDSTKVAAAWESAAARPPLPPSGRGMQRNGDPHAGTHQRFPVHGFAWQLTGHLDMVTRPGHGRPLAG